MPRLLTAAVITAVTLAISANAVQTVTSPNAATLSYSLAAGGISAAITPATSRPVLVMGVNNTLGVRGVGQVTMLHVPASFIEWTGIESPAAAAITSGFSGVAGTHIVFIDFSHNVDIEVNSPDTIRVHNTSAGVQTGNVTLIW